MDREQFFEWLNKYKGTYKFIEDDYGEVTIKFLVDEDLLSAVELDDTVEEGMV